MLQPIDVACGFCAAQPGEPCKPPVDSALGVHAQRIDSANFINGVASRAADERAFEPSPTQFEQAVLATGDV